MPDKPEDKKVEAKAEDRSVSLFNRGKRTFDLGLESGKDGKKSPRRHAPGESHLYTPSEAAKMSIYKEIVDLSKLPGQLDAKKLKSENEKLADENKKLKDQLASLQPKPKKSE